MKFAIYAIKSLFFSSNWYKKLALKKKEGLEITKPLNFKKFLKLLDVWNWLTMLSFK